MSGAWYNEIDPYAAQWLRNLAARGLIPAGEVDERSIVDVAPDDLRGFTQCHFFAGLGGWALAARLAGWPDARQLWTGSAPCQPFSVAGKGEGAADARHLWPYMGRLVGACRPAVWVGEQVAAAVGKGWLDGVFADLEALGYACRAAVVPACAVDAPHRRDRLWALAERLGPGLVGDGLGAGLEGHARDDRAARGWSQPDRPAAEAGRGGLLADADGLAGGEGRSLERGRDPGGDALAWPGSRGGRGTAWAGAGWVVGHDGKARRVESSIRLLADGVPARVGRLRAYGNAIVPQVGAEVLGAYLDCRP